MKHILCFLPFVLLMVGCNNHHQIVDNGKKASKKINIENITGFYISGMSKIEFIKSDSNKIEIQGTEKQLADLTISTSSDLIKITSGGSDQENPPLYTYVYSKDITNIQVSGSGEVIIGDVLQNEKAKVEANGIGGVNAILNCETINFSANGLGKLTLSGQVKNGDIDINAVGALETKQLRHDNVSINTTAVASHNM